jgi:hypothetical protein
MLTSFTTYFVWLIWMKPRNLALIGFFIIALCHNPSLGLTTKARACKGASQEVSMGVTSHAPESVGKCEGMNLHTPKWAPTLGVGVSMDSQIFKERLQGSKPMGLRSSLNHWEDLGTYMFKVGLYDPFGHFKHKLWLKEGSEVKLAIWLSTIKSRESPDFLTFRWCVTYRWKALVKV